MNEKVLAMRFFSEDAEGILRGALSQVCEIKARGKSPYLVVLLGEDDCLPQIGRNMMMTTDLLACASRLQLEADDVMREMYTDGD